MELKPRKIGNSEGERHCWYILKQSRGTSYRLRKSRTASVYPPKILNLTKPRRLFACGQPTIAESAAADGLGVVKHFPFMDGKQLAGFMHNAGVWERIGSRFMAGEADAALQILALAAGEFTGRNWWWG